MRDLTLQGFTREFLASLFAYDPTTGLITRRVTRAANAKAGDVVGTVDGKGYLHVNLLGKFIRSHRLAWFLTHGEVPYHIDHCDNAKTNNRIDNLRPCDEKGNAGNASSNPRNISGYRGVSRNNRSGKWHAQIKINGKQTYLGRFDNPGEAAMAYDIAAVRHFGEFAKLNHAEL
jgi:hypothetical protein